MCTHSIAKLKSEHIQVRNWSVSLSPHLEDCCTRSLSFSKCLQYQAECMWDLSVHVVLRWLHVEDNSFNSMTQSHCKKNNRRDDSQKIEAGVLFGGLYFGLSPSPCKLPSLNCGVCDSSLGKKGETTSKVFLLLLLLPLRPSYFFYLLSCPFLWKTTSPCWRAIPPAMNVKDCKSTFRVKCTSFPFFLANFGLFSGKGSNSMAALLLSFTNNL